MRGRKRSVKRGRKTALRCRVKYKAAMSRKNCNRNGRMPFSLCNPSFNTILTRKNYDQTIDETNA